MGFLPWWLPLAHLWTFLAGMTVLLILVPRTPSAEFSYWTGTTAGSEEQPIIDR